MEPDYFERLLARFDADPSLGIASGSAFELRRRQLGAALRHRQHRVGRVARVPVGVPAGAAPARGADGVGRRRRVQGERPWLADDRVRGPPVPPPSARGRARRLSLGRARANQGAAAHYLGYRSWYLVLRALWNARREPAALGMVWGYAAAAARRDAAEPRRARARVPPAPAEPPEPAASRAGGIRAAASEGDAAA